MLETWVPIDGFNYSVSELGRVRNDRTGRVLKPGQHGGKPGHRYLFVNLCNGKDRPRSVYIHRLVAQAFLGPCPEGKEVLHGPCGRFDNTPGNLRYGTRAENMIDRDRDGTTARGERSGKHKLTEGQVAIIKRHLSEPGVKQTALAREYRVAQQTIHAIKTGKTWRHIAAATS